MINLQTEVEINKPVDEVYGILADPDALPKWATGALEVTHDSGDPRNAGARYTQVSMFLGRRIESTYEVTRVEPNKRFGIRSLSGPVHFEFDYRFEPTGDATHLYVTAEGEPGGFFKVGAPILAAVGRRLLAANLENLKDLMEAGELVASPAPSNVGDPQPAQS